MTTTERLRLQIDPTLKEIYRYQLEGEENRYREHHAAVRVQSWVRGIETRQYIRHLSKSATLIQKRWRGFTVRKSFRDFLKERVYEMRLQNYNVMANLIQKTWRGYFSRKYVYNYYSRREYLMGILHQNAQFKKEMEEYLKEKQDEYERQSQLKHLENEKLWAAKHHHLKSTYVQPSIYNSPFLKEALPQEYLLGGVKYPLDSKSCSNMKRRKIRNPQLMSTDDNDYPFDPTFRSYDGEKEKHALQERLPPINDTTTTVQPNGPFKAREEVIQQRYKPFNPSLRVETDFYSLEEARQLLKRDEWCKRLYDDIFMPVKVRPPSYEPMLIGKCTYTRNICGYPEQYGTMHFREVDVTKHTDPVNYRFKTLVPPINQFDKLNKEYVNNYLADI